MSPRTVVVALVLGLFVLPANARAEEPETTPAASPFVPTVTPVMLLPARSSFVPPLLAPAPTEMRLSHREKTVIIVIAIVVGSLLVIGTVAVASNRHDFPP